MWAGFVASPSHHPEPTGRPAWREWRLRRRERVKVDPRTLAQRVGGAWRRREVTRVGLLQLVPAEEGSFLLLAEVGALLQEPVGDPTLTDPWTDGERERE